MKQIAIEELEEFNNKFDKMREEKINYRKMI